MSRVTVRWKRVSRIDEWLMEDLLKLSYPDGSMYGMLVQSHGNRKIVIAWLDGVPIGWAIRRKIDLGVFVSYKHRRQGIGTRLIKKIVPTAAKARTARPYAWGRKRNRFWYGIWGESWRNGRFIKARMETQCGNE